MAQGNHYKPRYKITYKTHSKIWSYKNGYLRRFYSVRGSRIKRRGLFLQCVLVATTIKWVEARRIIRPHIVNIASTQKYPKGTTPFGRPISYKGRYRNNFHTKQQLRFFYGKIKEETFRNLFKTHLKSLSTRTNSFFTSLESRLDIVFFRMRLLPTIFACHQYIHHQGVELNGIIEKAPAKLVIIGDIISISPSLWKTVYLNIFDRIYFRRWGLYLAQRRNFTRIKTKIFHLNKSINDDYFEEFTAELSELKKINTQKDPVVYPNQFDFIQEGIFYQDQIKSFIQEYNTAILKLKTKEAYLIPVNIAYLTSFWVSNQEQVMLKHKTNDGSHPSDEFTAEFDMVYSKLCHYQKLYYTTYFRKSTLPVAFNYGYADDEDDNRRDVKIRCTKRSKRVRFNRYYVKQFKKNIRYNKFTRVKPIHFFIPTYLQIDFRTLRAIKIQSPALQDMHYPFRISLAKRNAFYRSKIS